MTAVNERDKRQRHPSRRSRRPRRRPLAGEAAGRPGRGGHLHPRPLD